MKIQLFHKVNALSKRIGKKREREVSNYLRTSYLQVLTHFSLYVKLRDIITRKLVVEEKKNYQVNQTVLIPFKIEARPKLYDCPIRNLIIPCRYS